MAALLCLALLDCVRVAAQAPDDNAKAYRAPGQLVDIGGRKLHLDCAGKGSPTVILVAGGGAYSIDWALVQPEIAKTTRVCSYDRAGLAWSDTGPANETVEQTVSDLHALLQSTHQPRPFVLVGASIGGIYIQGYQRAFPDEVGGLVFSNSSNRIGMNVKGKAGLLWELTEEDLRSMYPLPMSTKGPAPTIVGSPFDRLPAALQAARLWLDRKSWEKFDPSKAGPDAMLSWRKEFLKEFDASASRERPLGALPVVVIASDPAANEDERLTRSRAGAKLDFLSSNTLHVQAKGSGHEIHLFQPETVVKGILQAVSAIRNRTTLAASTSR